MPTLCVSMNSPFFSVVYASVPYYCAPRRCRMTRFSSAANGEAQRHIAEVRPESKSEAAASLLADPVLRPPEAMVLGVVRSGEPLQIDEILELPETQMTFS